MFVYSSFWVSLPATKVKNIKTTRTIAFYCASCCVISCPLPFVPSVLPACTLSLKEYQDNSSFASARVLTSSLFHLDRGNYLVFPTALDVNEDSLHGLQCNKLTMDCASVLALSDKTELPLKNWQSACREHC